MRRPMALLMAILLACPACAVRLSLQSPGSTLARRIGARQQPQAQAPRPADGALWQRYLNSLPVGSRVEVQIGVDSAP